MCNLCGKHPPGPILCFKVNWKHPSFAAQMRWGVMSLRDDENSFSGLAIVCALVELHVNKTCHLSGRSAAPSYTVFTCRQGKKKKKRKKCDLTWCLFSREIGTIIYSLGCFPTQADLHDFIAEVRTVFIYILLIFWINKTTCLKESSKPFLRSAITYKRF